MSQKRIIPKACHLQKSKVGTVEWNWTHQKSRKSIYSFVIKLLCTGNPKAYFTCIVSPSVIHLTLISHSQQPEPWAPRGLKISSGCCSPLPTHSILDLNLPLGEILIGKFISSLISSLPDFHENIYISTQYNDLLK